MDRPGVLERVQVKHTRSDGRVIEVPCLTSSLTHGRVRTVHRYTAVDIDWLAVWDATTDGCFYVPAAKLGDGCSLFTLRLEAARNGQRQRVHAAADYREI